MTFTDGVALDEYFETTEGPFWVTGKVHIVSTHLFLGDLLIYPMTGKPARIGVRQLFGIVRILVESMKAQGLQRYSLGADRMYSHKPGRIISMTGRLR